MVRRRAVVVRDAAIFPVVFHRLAHEKLKSRLRDLSAEIGACADAELPKEAIDRLMTLLRDWLIEHIIKEDFLMKPLLARQDPRFTG